MRVQRERGRRREIGRERGWEVESERKKTQKSVASKRAREGGKTVSSTYVVSREV